MFSLLREIKQPCISAHHTSFKTISVALQTCIGSHLVVIGFLIIHHAASVGRYCSAFYIKKITSRFFVFSLLREHKQPCISVHRTSFKAISVALKTCIGSHLVVIGFLIIHHAASVGRYCSAFYIKKITSRFFVFSLLREHKQPCISVHRTSFKAISVALKTYIGGHFMVFSFFTIHCDASVCPHFRTRQSALAR